MASKLFEKFYQQIEALTKATVEKNFPNKMKLRWDLSMSSRQTDACQIKFPGKILQRNLFCIHWKSCKLGRYSRNLFRNLECTRQYSLQKVFESFLAFILQVSKNMEELILNKNEAAGSNLR